MRSLSGADESRSAVEEALGQTQSDLDLNPDSSTQTLPLQAFDLPIRGNGRYRPLPGHLGLI